MPFNIIISCFLKYILSLKVVLEVVMLSYAQLARLLDELETEAGVLIFLGCYSGISCIVSDKSGFERLSAVTHDVAGNR